MGLHVNFPFQANNTHITTIQGLGCGKQKLKILSTINCKPNIGVPSRLAGQRKADLIVIRKGDDGAADPKNHGGMDFAMCVYD
jgi:hypothetical protein